MNKDSKIYVAGHGGMVGSAVVRCLQSEGYKNIVGRSSRELDLTRQEAVEAFFASERPECVFLAAARVGGILANKTYRAEFIYVNLQIEANIIHSAWKFGVKKLLFFASSCIYPRMCPQPMKEEMLWSGHLEPTNSPYAAAKLAGIALCQAYNEQHGTDFISVVPTNLYGPNDNFDPEQSHVMAAMILKFHNAKLQKAPNVTLWGTGTPRRELMFVDDAAAASVFLFLHTNEKGPINIGIGTDHSILEIAQIAKRVVEYEGDIVFDTTKPDGAPRKLLDVTRLQAHGWKPRVNLEEGVTRAYQWFLESGGKRRGD
ncbi:MAG: GDP-L-fucose synthase [Verrucomicrobiota bacterium]